MRDKTGVNLIRELRLTICGLLFSTILTVAPKDDDPEGRIIIEAAADYARRSKLYFETLLQNEGIPAKKKGR